MLPVCGFTTFAVNLRTKQDRRKWLARWPCQSSLQRLRPHGPRHEHIAASWSAAHVRASGRRWAAEHLAPRPGSLREWRKSCRRTSSIPASRLARHQRPRLRDCDLAGSLGDGNTKALPVRGWRVMTACAASLSHTVHGPVLASANLSMSPSISDHRSVRISLFRLPVSRSRRMTSACGRREGLSSTSRSRVR